MSTRRQQAEQVIAAGEQALTLAQQSKARLVADLAFLEARGDDSPLMLALIEEQRALLAEAERGESLAVSVIDIARAQAARGARREVKGRQGGQDQPAAKQRRERVAVLRERLADVDISHIDADVLRRARDELNKAKLYQHRNDRLRHEIVEALTEK